jgi:hypothetical protein
MRLNKPPKDSNNVLINLPFVIMLLRNEKPEFFKSQEEVIKKEDKIAIYAPKFYELNYYQKKQKELNSEVQFSGSND